MKAFIKLSLGFLILVVLSVSACRAQPEQEVEQVDLPEEIEAEPEIMEQAVPKQDWAHDYIDWPQPIPQEFPAYADGDILDYPFHPESYPNFVTIENTSIESIQEYVDNALSEGYALEWEMEKMGDEDLSWAINMETENAHFGIVLAYFESFSGSPGYLSITLSKIEK